MTWHHFFRWQVAVLSTGGLQKSQHGTQWYEAVSSALNFPFLKTSMEPQMCGSGRKVGSLILLRWFCLASLFRGKRRFRQVDYKIRKTQYEAVSSALNFPFLNLSGSDRPAHRFPKLSRAKYPVWPPIKMTISDLQEIYLPFWRKSRSALFLMLSSSKHEEVLLLALFLMLSTSSRRRASFSSLQIDR